MTTQLDDLTRAFAQQDQAAGFLVGSLLADELKFLADDPALLAHLGASRGIPRPVLALAVKAAVSAGSTTDATWAGPLAASGADARAFLALAERLAVLPRLGAVRVTGSVAGAVQVTHATADWVGEHAHKPIRAMSFTATSLTPRTLTANIIVSDELAKLGSPGTLPLLQRALSVSLIAALDSALLDPTSGAIAGVRPASLTNGLTGITPVGDFQNQIGQALAGISGGAASRPVLIVGAQTAVRLTGLRDLADAGIRVLVSPAAADRMIAIDPDGVLFVDDGVELRRGTPDLMLDSDPDGVVQAAGAAAVHTSLWQANMTAVKALRHVSWAKRADAVAYLTLV
ncbi:MAG: hypothetical protein H0X67_08180 [Acidobacteria bacterium]|nr:hypothetical protein [Acidobacteriota bacterium]